MGIAFDHIFHPTDFSEGNQSALAHALRLSHLAQGNISIMHVCDPEENVQWSSFPSVRQLFQRWKLLGAGASHEDVSMLGMKVKKVVRPGKKAAPVITEYVADKEPDLIVLSTHQRKGMSRWSKESTAHPVACKSKVATLFIPRQVKGFVSKETGNVNLRHIMIPVQRSPSPLPAIDAAVRMATLCECEDVCFTTVYVGHKGDQPVLEIPLQTGWTHRNLFKGGNVVEDILFCSESLDIDMVVMSTKDGKGFLDKIRGSVTEQVLQGVKCPLLLVSC
ncbi:universal stress protein [Verrucomicrobia bacterium]|nr:universal stress protein [Verrucomicrobiota bacterium]MDG1892013.1 universal stress protein [Verrucomicrobiota bacterium]